MCNIGVSEEFGQKGGDVRVLYHVTYRSSPCCAGIAVGIATRYGLDGSGIESRWGRDFSHLSRPALRPTQPPIQWVAGLSRGWAPRLEKE